MTETDHVHWRPDTKQKVEIHQDVREHKLRFTKGDRRNNFMDKSCVKSSKGKMTSRFIVPNVKHSPP